MSDTTQGTRLEPIVTLMWDKAEDGSFFARMTLSGLQSAEQAQGAMNLMQDAFCGKPMEPDQ